MGASDLTLPTDHKPLINIFNDRKIRTLENPLVLKIKEKTLMYRYRIIHMPRKSKIMKIQPYDIISFHPSTRSAWLTGIAHLAHQLKVHNPVSSPRHSYSHMLHKTHHLQRIPSNKRPAITSELHTYWSTRDDIYSIDGVPFKDANF